MKQAYTKPYIKAFSMRLECPFATSGPNPAGDDEFPDVGSNYYDDEELIEWDEYNNENNQQR